jgi:hypothetical protein
MGKLWKRWTKAFCIFFNSLLILLLMYKNLYVFLICFYLIKFHQAEM